MKHKILFIFTVLFLAVPDVFFAQAWNLVKERDGIKIYTRKEANSSLKSFKGEVDLRTTVEKVNYYVGNFKNFDWWDESIKEIKVLDYEKDKFIKYYLVYDVPWPFSDRDLCVEAKMTDDPVTGKRVVYAQPLPDVVPEKPGIVRIKKYWQRWIVQPKPGGIVHVTLEGFVDPAGNVPSWLYNMVITDSPLKVIRGIQRRVE